MTDRSRGWDAVALALIAGRQESRIGAEVIRAWSRTLPRNASVLDLGCGSGVPVTEVLVEAGCRVWGVDASPRLISAFRARFPGAPAACEPAEDSSYFDRRFDAVVAVGLVFLLPESSQRRLIAKVASALEPGGQFLFTAPRLPCTWTDAWTGEPSRSLGSDVYRAILGEVGLVLVGTHVDEGYNYYLQALRPAASTSTATAAFASDPVK
jgi:SAM-dependent methyltransferase